jgi:hypothetical protein
MKYISKPEAALHTKLTIAADIQDALLNSSTTNYISDVNISNQFLLKTYNKLDTQHEVGTHEAISHLLVMLHYYIDRVFKRLYIFHFLQSIK